MESQLFLPLRCSLSQNDSIPRVGMDLWTSFSSTPCQGRTQSRFCRKASMWVLSVSREGSFKICLSSLFQFSAILYVKKYVHQKIQAPLPEFHKRIYNLMHKYMCLCFIFAQFEIMKIQVGF